MIKTYYPLKKRALKEERESDAEMNLATASILSPLRIPLS